MAKVFFHSARPSQNQSVLEKVKDLFEQAGLDRLFKRNDKVAVKVHWGEKGNVAYLPVPYVRTLVELLWDCGARPFVTDTNVLYRGERFDALSNLKTAAENGYTTESLKAPIIVADGLVGRDWVEVDLEGGFVTRPRVASAIYHADGMLVASHVKGHLLFGFGGALKQLSMGCAAPSGKHTMHCQIKPRVIPRKCVACERCLAHCPSDAISMVAYSDPEEPHKERVAKISRTDCIGCGECVLICPEQAIPINWKSARTQLFGRSADYAAATVKAMGGKLGLINFLINITPDCDCCGWHDLPLVPDVGYLASSDPVAIDAASLDLVDAAAVMPGSVNDGRDVSKGHFMAVHEVEPRDFLVSCEAAQVGSRDYELVRL